MIAEIYGIRNIRSVDLSYFDRKVGVQKGLCQICSAHFKTTQKDLRIQHSRDKKAKKNRNFLNSIVTGDETLRFQYEPETKRHSSKW